MSGARNPLCSCHKSGAYRTRGEAEDALRRVLDAPPNPVDPRPYKPVAVVRCAAGVWHLTTNAGKRWKAGKPRRRRAR